MNENIINNNVQTDNNNEIPKTEQKMSENISENLNQVKCEEQSDDNHIKHKEQVGNVNQIKNRKQKQQNKPVNSQKEVRVFRGLLYAEITVIFAILAFLLGGKLGRDTLQEQLKEAMSRIEQLESEQESLRNEIKEQKTYESNQIYGADQEDVSVGYVEEKQLTEEEREELYETFLDALYEDTPNLILVNKDHKLKEDYKVELKKLPDGTNRGSAMAYTALTTMLKDGRREGLNFEICSSYRSVERQQELLDEDIDALMAKGYTYKKAYAEVTRETMPPGYSEHATGLAFDIVALSYQMLDSYQERTAEVKWLRKHCAEYGFILRYPEDKEHITGISYESWHFRYVGEEAAEYIMENEITLEEYLEEKFEEYLEEYLMKSSKKKGNI